MKHDAIETNSPQWRASTEVADRFDEVPAAARRFAAVCAGIPGARVVDDIADRVALSFGERTDEVRDRLRTRGWGLLRALERDGQRMLDISFTGGRRAEATADALAADLAAVVGEIDIGETRVW